MRIREEYIEINRRPSLLLPLFLRDDFSKEIDLRERNETKEVSKSGQLTLSSSR